VFSRIEAGPCRSHLSSVKAFDHDRPANRDEWLFAFVEAYRALRPEIGEKYAKTHAVTAYSSLQELKPAQAAKEWL